MSHATLSEAISELAGADAIESSNAVGGGCIAQSSRLRLRDGRTLFCKRGGSVAMFHAEADGLLALGEAGLPVPEVLAVGKDEGFLLLEDHSGGRRQSDYWEHAGRALATCHRVPQRALGWHVDNFIGATPQPNAGPDNWPRYFGEIRLGYQIRLLRDSGAASTQLQQGVEQLIARCPEFLPADPPRSLVHGDLWGGNLMTARDGGPLFIDPAVYVGHREVDLAMTELFGGFDQRFYRAYQEAWPLEPGYEQRRDIYNCYHLLNHANLFGGGYASSALAVVRRYV